MKIKFTRLRAQEFIAEVLNIDTEANEVHVDFAGIDYEGIEELVIGPATLVSDLTSDEVMIDERISENGESDRKFEYHFTRL